MNTHELSSALMSAKDLVTRGNGFLDINDPDSSKQCLYRSLDIYNDIINGADKNDPKGSYYGKFSYIAAVQNSQKVIRMLINMHCSTEERINLESMLRKMEETEITREDMDWFYRQRCI